VRFSSVAPAPSRGNDVSLPTLLQWRQKGQPWSWRGHQIFSISEGTGEPLLLIHGFPTSSYDWALIWPALNQRFRLLALDMLGFGFSAKPWPHDYSIAEQADLFEDFLAHHGVTQYRLLAHDYGDTVAQELLARQREGAKARLLEIKLLNGGLFPETHRPLLIQRLLASPLAPLVTRLMSYRAFASSMHRIWGARKPDEAMLQALWQGLAEDRGVRVLAGLIGYIDERRRHRERWVGALIDCDLPLSVIVGQADPVSGAHMAVRCRTLLPHAEVIELPDVGHYPQLEAPSQVLSALRWDVKPS
jgi:pimeloyl-ACP methyl ester carboxylesterase